MLTYLCIYLGRSEAVRSCRRSLARRAVELQSNRNHRQLTSDQFMTPQEIGIPLRASQSVRPVGLCSSRTKCHGKFKFGENVASVTCSAHMQFRGRTHCDIRAHALYLTLLKNAVTAFKFCVIIDINKENFVLK